MSSWKHRSNATARDEGWIRKETSRSDNDRLTEPNVTQDARGYRSSDRVADSPARSRFDRQDEEESGRRERDLASSSTKTDRWGRTIESASINVSNQRPREDLYAESSRQADRRRRSSVSLTPDREDDRNSKYGSVTNRHARSYRRSPSPNATGITTRAVYPSRAMPSGQRSTMTPEIEGRGGYPRQSDASARNRADHYDEDLLTRDQDLYSTEYSGRGNRVQPTSHRVKENATSSHSRPNAIPTPTRNDPYAPRPIGIQSRRKHSAALGLEREANLNTPNHGPLKRNAMAEGSEDARKRQRRSPQPDTPSTASVGWDRWRRGPDQEESRSNTRPHTPRTGDREDAPRWRSERDQSSPWAENRESKHGGGSSSRSERFPSRDDRLPVDNHNGHPDQASTRDRWNRRTPSRSPLRRSRNDPQYVDAKGRHESPPRGTSRSQQKRSDTPDTPDTPSPRSHSPTERKRGMTREHPDVQSQGKRRSPSPFDRSNARAPGVNQRDRKQDRLYGKLSQPDTPLTPENALRTGSADVNGRPSQTIETDQRPTGRMTPDTPPSEGGGESSRNETPSVQPSVPRFPRGQPPTGPRNPMVGSDRPMPSTPTGIPTGPAADRKAPPTGPSNQTVRSRTPDSGALTGARGFVSIALPKKTPTQPRRDRLAAGQGATSLGPAGLSSRSSDTLEALSIKKQLGEEKQRYSQMLQQSRNYVRLSMELITKRDPSLSTELVDQLRISFRREPTDAEVRETGSLYRQLKAIKGLEARQIELSKPPEQISEEVAHSAHSDRPVHVEQIEAQGSGGDGRVSGWRPKETSIQRTPSPEHQGRHQRSALPVEQRPMDAGRWRHRSRSYERELVRRRSASRSRSPNRSRRRSRSRSTERRPTIRHRHGDDSSRRDTTVPQTLSAQQNVGAKPSPPSVPPPAPAPVVAPIEPKIPRGRPYEKVVQVGEGTYGKVYKARNKDGLGLVALKRIRMEGEKDGFPVTAMREIKLLQGLEHDNIIRLHEMMVAHGSVYMVFDYMEHDLTGVLNQAQFLFTEAHLKSLSHQMLAGLSYLHRKSILHRDLKGSNILLNSQGILKLADFGLARFYNKKKRNDHTNRVITLWYRSPELLMGETVYGASVDMWSAGCIMLELFIRKPVFQGNDEIHQLEVIFNTMGTPHAENWPGLGGLPWYELVKPKVDYPSRLVEMFGSTVGQSGLAVVEGLLSYDPEKRLTADEALATSYFTSELPRPETPTHIADVQGEWHEMEAKQDRARKRQQESQAGGETAKPKA